MQGSWEDLDIYHPLPSCPIHHLLFGSKSPKSCLLISDLTLSGAGGGEKHPPSHTFAIPRKKLMGKVANFF